MVMVIVRGFFYVGFLLEGDGSSVVEKKFLGKGCRDLCGLVVRLGEGEMG